MPLLKYLFILSPIILVAHINSLCADSLINVPVDNRLYIFSDDIYDFVARLAARGIIDNLPKNTHPYSRGEVAKILMDVSSKADGGKIKLSAIAEKHLETMKTLFSDALEDKSITSEMRKTKKTLLYIRNDENHFAVGGGVSQKAIFREGKGFPAYGKTSITYLLPSISGQIEESFAFSCDMKWEFHVGDIFPDLFLDEATWTYTNLPVDMKEVASTQAYAKFKLPWFDIELGKDNVRWGPGYHGQLIISDNPQPMDMIRIDGRYGKIKAQIFTAKLGSEMGDKYLSTHRAELALRKGIDLGISEVIVYGDRFEVSYMNPFQTYLITQNMIESSAKKIDNVLAGVDFSHRIANKLQVYGELVVDDAAPLETPLNHWDTKFGILAGIYIVDPFSVSDTDLRMEYTFINQYCYTHEVPINAYKHYSSVIGHWLGPDADDLWCELKHRFTDKIESIFAYELERHGEGGIDKPHPNDAPANDRWKFLSGVNKSKHSLSLGVSYAKIGYYSFKAKYTHSWLKNINNSKDVDGGRQAIFEASYQL